jgi:hypothetical protein
MVRGQAVFARSQLSVLLALALVLALGCGACDSLSEFGGNFTGSIVQGSFVRSCFGAEWNASLHFVAPSAVGSTRGLSKEERNWLTLTDKDHNPVFDSALEPIYPLTADTLADFDFPGQKRLRNYMLLARSSIGPLAERDAVVVISLLATKKVEVRVFARAAPDDKACEVPPEDEVDDLDAGAETPRYPQYYGLFKLSK